MLIDSSRVTEVDSSVMLSSSPLPTEIARLRPMLTPEAATVGPPIETES